MIGRFSWQWSDWLPIQSSIGGNFLTGQQLGNVVGFGLVHVQIHYGFGRPQYYLTKWEIIEFRKYVYGEWIQTFATLMWTKVSICLFLRRIPVTNVLTRPLDAAIVFLVVSNLIITILWIVQCRPLNVAWNSNLKGTCLSRGQLERIVLAQAGMSTKYNTAVSQYVSSNPAYLCMIVISAISDFAFAAYPILILWKVQMKLTTKIGLCCLMGLGVL